MGIRYATLVAYPELRSGCSSQISQSDAIYRSEELDEASTIKNFLIVRQERSRSVKRQVKHYNLDAIIAVGYRVNSKRATAFRRWATKVLRDFVVKGYVLDSERLKNGKLFNKQYFEALLEEIREIRASERQFYQKVTDLFATASDYDSHSGTRLSVFSRLVQNKLHYAVHRHTANAEKPHIGLTSWKNACQGEDPSLRCRDSQELPLKNGA